MPRRQKSPKPGSNPNQGSLDLIPVADASGRESDSYPPVRPTQPKAARVISPELLEMIEFLIGIFGCRLDVYAEFWEYGDGKGYRPKCLNYRSPGVCNKVFDRKFKCKNCTHRQLAPLTPEVIYHHLTRSPHIGIYPLLPDHTCRFVVIDFDKQKFTTDEEWRTEILEVIAACKRHRVPHAVELSRSGAGIHLWIFFSDFVPAVLARKLALGLQNEAAHRLGLLKLSCYDRVLPNQDFLNNGGVGTVIALPFQFMAMKDGRSVFVDPDNDFKPVEHQFQFLKGVQRLDLQELNLKITQVVPEGEHELGVPFMLDQEPHQFWRKPKHLPSVIDSLPTSLTLKLGAGVTFDLQAMPRQLAAKLARLAAFPNPLFFMKQRQGFSTGGIPVIESQAVVSGHELTIPRGCLEAAVDLLTTYNVVADIIDQRSHGSPIDLVFTGSLREDQAEALDAMLAHDVGTLKAATSFGKTVMGAALIARRKVSTLIVVHRKHIARQWRTQLTRFLDIRPDQIGSLGGPRPRATGVVDIVMMATLSKMSDVQQLTDSYGQVIVDECHRSAAKSVVGKLNQIRSLYFEGLSATPKRSDGRQPLVFMVCGNVRYVSTRPTGAPQDLTVKSRQFKKLIPLAADATANDLYSRLIADTERTSLIIQEGLDAYARGRHVIILTGRKQHLRDLVAGFVGKVERIFTISSDLKAKERDLVMAEIEALPSSIPRIVVSTWQLVGEGFDHAPLNTLIQCLPYSWEGTVTQCAGRLDRYLPDKLDSEIIDIVDEGHPISLKMWKARRRAYRKIGYRVIDEMATMELF